MRHIILVGALSGLVGCCPQIGVHDPHCTHQPCYDANFICTVDNAITDMLDHKRPAIEAGDAFDPKKVVLYASTADLNDLGTTTNFGRLMGELLATSLTRHGVNKVVQMTVGDQFRISPHAPGNGQLLLSRNVADLTSQFNAGAYMLSSYSVALDRVYINVELINAQHQEVVAAVSFDIPLGPRTEALLRDHDFPSTATDVLSSQPGFNGRHVGSH